MIDVEEIATDVAVVGGGVAGFVAGVGAVDQGARVLMLEKSGSIAGGAGASGQKFYQSWIPGEREWDTPEEFFKRRWEKSLKIESPTRVRRYAEESWSVLQRLEQMGVRFRHPVHGRYVRRETMGWNAAYSILFDGRDFKKTIARYATSIGVERIHRTVGVSLLTEGDRVTGVVALRFADQRLLVVRAGAVVIATGQAGRYYPGVAGSPYNTWHNPYSTGTGAVMAYQAGAVLANLEFVAATLVPKGYGIPGMAALMGVGGYLVNALGERFMDRYHPLGDLAPRPYLVKGVLTETSAGRGPCYVDCSHLSQQDLDDLLRHLMLERGMWDEYFYQAGVDLRRQPMELELSELSCVNGVLTDEESASTVPGLYAAGECAGASGLGRCCVEGYRAGANAARHARDAAHPPFVARPPFVLSSSKHRPVDGSSTNGQVHKARARVEPFLEPSDGVHYRELEDSLREVMARDVGLEKCKEGLTAALDRLESFKNDGAQRLRARTPHELLRCLEAQDLLEFSLLATEASLHRTESRIGTGAGSGEMFWRSDYPELNSPEWEKIVTVQQRNGKRLARVEPVPA